MHFDEILRHVGTFGRYQKCIFLIVCVMAVPMSYHQFAQVFLAPDIDHWCKSPALVEPNCTAVRPPETLATCLEERKNRSIPRDEKGAFSQCYRYVMEDEDGDGVGYYGGQDVPSDNSSMVTAYNDTIKCDAGWEYDRTQYRTTVVQDFDLVCSRKNVPAVAQSLFFAGVLVSSFVCGLLADWIGRHRTLFICLGFQFVFSLATVFSPNIAAFIILRFMLAAANMGVYIMVFIICTEFVGPEWRTVIGVITECFFAAGYMLLAVTAYFVRDWRTLQLIGAVPIIFFFLLIRVVPESARWLISQGKTKQAEKIIRKIAKFNKAQLPEELFTGDSDVVQGRRSCLDLFRTPNLRKRTLNIMFNWFVNSVVYYGLSLSTSSLGTNNFVAFFISGAVEIPACLSIIFLIERYGRRFMLCSYLLLGGAACLFTILIAPGAGRTVVAMIGKFGISASFCLVYIYSAEIFPTPVRSMGIGLASMSARLGGIIAPPLLVLREVWEPFPLLVFGLLSIAAGLLTLLLPETLGLQMCETIDEGEELGVGEVFRLPHWRGWDYTSSSRQDVEYKQVGLVLNGTSDDAKDQQPARDTADEVVV